jgi:hypothetical protein
MANLDQFLIHKLNTTLARNFEKLDLRLNQKVESHLRDKKTRSRTSRVSDRRPDVEGGQVGGRVDRVERATKDGVEDIVDTSTTTELFGGNLSRGTVDRRNEGVCEACHLLKDERATVLLSAEMHVAVAGQLLLRLAHEGVEPSLDVRQTLTDVAHESGVKGLGQVVSAASGGNVAVGRVVLEEISLGLKSILHRLVSLNILLRSVDHADETKLQRVNSTRENIQSIGAVIHKINLGQNSNGSSAKRVDMTGELEGFGVDDIDVGGRDREDDTVRLGDVFGDKVSGLLLNIGGLIANRDLRYITISMDY